MKIDVRQRDFLIIILAILIILVAFSGFPRVFKTYFFAIDALLIAIISFFNFRYHKPVRTQIHNLVGSTIESVRGAVKDALENEEKKDGQV